MIYSAKYNVERLSHRHAIDPNFLIRMCMIIVFFTSNSDYEPMVHFANYLPSIPFVVVAYILTFFVSLSMSSRVLRYSGNYTHLMRCKKSGTTNYIIYRRS